MSRKTNSAFPLPKKIDDFLSKLPLDNIKKGLSTLAIICIGVGIVLTIYGYMTDTKEATITDVKDDRVIVEIGQIKSDPITVEFKKDKHTDYEVGNTVYVSKNKKHIYNKLSPDKCRRIIMVGEGLIALPIVIYFGAIFIIMVVMSIIFFGIILPKTLIKINKLNTLYIISFICGAIIACIAALKNANLGIIIGDILMLMPIVVGIYVGIKKSKKSLDNYKNKR